MTSEARNTVVVVGADPPSNAPEARNVVVVVGADLPSNAPDVRNVVVVVGADDLSFVGSGPAFNHVGARRRRRIHTFAN